MLISQSYLPVLSVNNFQDRSCDLAEADTSVLTSTRDMVECSRCRMASKQWIPNISTPKYILSTNEAPSEADAAQLRCIVTKGTKDLEDIENEIHRLKGALDHLISSREMLATRLSKCQRALNPVRRLPTELLAEIFLYFSGVNQGQVVTDEIPKLMKAHRPLLNVCRSWRETAISLQDLWSFIDIKLGFRDTGARLANLANLVAIHLQRSKRAPLYINLTSRNGINVLPFINSLVQHSTRWQFARIAIPAASLRQLIGIKGSLGRLHTLDLCVTDSHIPDAEVFEMFNFIPQLSSLSLSTYVSGRHSLPWSQLRRLELSLSVSQCLNILSLAPDITELLLSCEHKTFDNLNTPAAVHLGHLHTLHINGLFGSSISVLSHLTTPALESFSLNVLSLQLVDKDTMETTDLINILLPFVRQSSHTLKSLTLYGSSLEVEVFLALLRGMPNLRHFYLDDHCGLITCETVQNHLRYNPDTQTCLIPLLETIEIRVTSTPRFKPFECDIFIDMIVSRWRVTTEARMARLQSVSLIDNSTFLGREGCKRLEDLQREGLRIQFPR